MKFRMRRSCSINLVCGTMLTILAGCAGADPVSAAKMDSTVGRYQIAPGTGEVWLLDQTTGHVWLHTKNTGEGWGDMGTPVSPK
jgi:hypothetical protein